MKKLKLFSLALIGLAFISIVSCKKGDTGPQGPAGPAGPDSVYHSAWIALNTPLAATFPNSSGGTDSVYEQVITSTYITQEILDSGLVLSYIEDNNGNISDISNYSGFLDVYYAVGKMTIDSYNVDLTNGGYVRFVLIPGTILVTNSILKNYTKEQLKAIDYSVISKALNLNTNKNTN
ncbi:MAG TPA: hypothetical protein VMT76_04825 [Puia sp.]|nr:hypothetical protein [Puia sp.]